MSDDLKWAALAIGLALVDGLICHVLHWSLFSQSALLALSAWFITLLLALVFFGFYFSKKKASQTPKSLIHPLNQTLSTIKKTSPKIFSKELKTLYEQGLRLQHKTNQLDVALQDYFGNSRLSYVKFATSINGGIEAFQANVLSILVRMDGFDALGYEDLFKRHLEYTSAMDPYQESLTFIHQALQTNEAILTRFDRLLVEVKALSHPILEQETSQALHDLNTLIEQTKRYQQKS